MKMKWKLGIATACCVTFGLTSWYLWPEIKVARLKLPASDVEVYSSFGLPPFRCPPLPLGVKSEGYCASSRSLGFCRQLTLNFDPSKARREDGSNCINYVIGAHICYYRTRNGSSNNTSLSIVANAPN